MALYIRNLLLALCSCAILRGVTAGASISTNEPFTASLYSSVAGPRSLLLDTAGDILVLAQGSNSIYAFSQAEDDRIVSHRILNTGELELTHGLAVHQGRLYASSSNTVYSWPYVPGNRTLIRADPFPAVTGMPLGGHRTRSLIFDSQSRLYVSIGSEQNVDRDSSRAMIRRFDLSDPEKTHVFTDGEVFADGLRNTVGLTFDQTGVLWGVDNGADDLFRSDLGGDIHNDNPAEELNRFNQLIGTHYGYPYCFSSGVVSGHSKGTQFAWPDFMNDGTHSDAWCRNITNNQPPTLTLPAHEAPLGIQFYDGTGCDAHEGSFPCSFKGDAFVALHGSWNRDVPVGYRVVRLPFTKVAPFQPTGEVINVVYETNPVACTLCFRPVSLAFNQLGHLIVSADASGEIFRVLYQASPANSAGLTPTANTFIILLSSIVFYFVF